MHPAIQIEGISKQYRIGTTGLPTYRTLRETLSDASAATLRGALKFARRKENHNGNAANDESATPTGTFWALNDISFDVQPGEVVGIIGRNGAGKSTLLKILSRITEPTHGRITLNGRVASLLEVGTGFHQELTGRENIYLNGAILGMTRREIARKFEEIVEFSGVDKFLDTPVKRYSSGMYVRLAFAVAAHLEPEILIVDEVLAVGDADFQEKCLGKMQDVAASGRTVLFVSHNMPAVESLCDRAILLNAGKVLLDEDSRITISEYLRQEDQACSEEDFMHHSIVRKGTGEARIVRAMISPVVNPASKRIAAGEGFEIHTTITSTSTTPNCSLQIILLDSAGRRICEFSSDNCLKGTTALRPSAPMTLKCIVPSNNLLPGYYGIRLALRHSQSRCPIDLPMKRLVLRIVDENRRVAEPTSALIKLPATWTFSIENSQQQTTI